jgi:hypothetical protein
MAGRHRRPTAWRRILDGMVRSRNRARRAALLAEVAALRVTVAEMRAAVAHAEAEAARLAADLATTRAELTTTTVELATTRAELATAREQLTAPVHGPVMPPATLEMPLVRLALSRSVQVQPLLTREMAIALASPDRGPDTVRTEIVLADLPERPLLDPKADRDTEARDDITQATTEATTPAARIA